MFWKKVVPNRADAVGRIVVWEPMNAFWFKKSHRIVAPNARSTTAKEKEKPNPLL